jgi:hypothetical protein
MNLMAPKQRENHHVIQYIISSVMKNFCSVLFSVIYSPTESEKACCLQQANGSGYVTNTVSWLKKQETIKDQYPKRTGGVCSTIPGNGYDKFLVCKVP